VKRLIKAVAVLMLVVALCAVLLAAALRGFTLLKAYGNSQEWWSAPPSLGAWDPKERIDAAEAEGYRYGGKP
jgi:hypothetical protein